MSLEIWFYKLINGVIKAVSQLSLSSGQGVIGVL